MNCSRCFIECDVTHRTNILELLPCVPLLKNFLQLAAAAFPTVNDDKPATRQQQQRGLRKGSRKT